MFLSSHRNMSEGLEKWEMLWEQKHIYPSVQTSLSLSMKQLEYELEISV